MMIPLEQGEGGIPGKIAGDAPGFENVGHVSGTGAETQGLSTPHSLLRAEGNAPVEMTE